MALVVVTLKVMPESVDVDLKELEAKVKKEIIRYAGEGDMRIQIEPIAFGLKALKIIFVVDESKGGTDDLEKKISSLDGVNSVQVVDVRRALG